jgi:3-oxoadipate enol-lactonase
MTHQSQTQVIQGPAGKIAVHMQGPENGPAVLLTHSILSSSMMWLEQAYLLSSSGWRVIAIDTRGHGQSECQSVSCTMDDLVADTIAVMDALHIEKAHYMGLSLGGMSGVGLGIQHAHRLLSLVLCDCRADMPSPMGDVWNERITSAINEGCQSLAVATTERWFGVPFIDANQVVSQAFRQTIASTTASGFVSCARAIQGLNYLDKASQISVPTTLIVGAKDGPLPQAMQDMQKRIAGAKLEIIPDAGHLPNIDQSVQFNAAMMRHFFQNPAWSQA